MKSNDKLKEIDIKSSAYYYSNKITKLQNFDLYNVLIDETSYKCFSLLRIRLDKIEGFIRICDGIKYQLLF